MADTQIDWCDKVWNPVTGCSKVSTGCKNCYAERMAKRLAGRAGYPAENPFAVTLHPDRLDQPLHWRKPQRVFVNSMSDLFHEDVPFEFVEQVWDTMFNCGAVTFDGCPRHTFMILTKRPSRMLEFTHWLRDDRLREPRYRNVWLGVSVEDQATADERTPYLRRCPAALRFLSVEPMLGPIPMLPLRGISWVIAGGESGPHARPAHPDWFRSVRDQCAAAGVPFWFKQWGEWFEIPCNDDYPPPYDRRERYLNLVGGYGFRGYGFHGEAVVRVRRVGRAVSGDLLDGVRHKEAPGGER